MTDTDIPASDETAVFDAIGRLEGTKDAPDKRVPFIADEQAVVSPPAGSALLIVQRGSPAGVRLLLDTNRITAGRHSCSDILLGDVTVSRKYCELLRGDGGYLVHDIGSSSGTYVDRIRVESHLLTAGKEVQIGKSRLTYYSAVA